MYKFYFEKLEVWQNSRVLVNDIYLITKSFPKEETFQLKSQMIRSASSVKSNIAEGQGRRTKKDQIHFISISFSSLIELLNHIITALDQKYIKQVDYDRLRNRIEFVANQLNALKRAKEK